MAAENPPDGDNLPEDLITEILLKLPVESLLRLKAVSKSWLSLISSPTFIDSYLRRAIGNSEDDSYIISGDECPISQIHLLGSDEIPAVDLPLPYSRRKYPFVPRLCLIGTCNGIVCATLPSKPIIFIWNPATRHSMLTTALHTKHSSVFLSCHGFGFDSIANDFKVVRFVKIGRPCAEVFSANNNVWRSIEPPILDFTMDDILNVSVKGFLCCLTDTTLILFDLNKEVFNCGIMLPVDIQFLTCVSEFTGSIGVIGYLNDEADESRTKITMWRLDDACLSGEMEGSWTLIFNVDVGFAVESVRSYLSSGGLLYTSSDNDVCSFYDPDKKESKRVPVPKNRTLIFKYTESLVSIRGFKRVG